MFFLSYYLVDSIYNEKMMGKRRQVSIFFLALLLLEVSGLGSFNVSNSDSDDILTGHLTGPSNGRANTRLNGVLGKPHRSANGRALNCPDKIFVCLDHQGEPLGESMLHVVSGPTNQLIPHAV